MKINKLNNNLLDSKTKIRTTYLTVIDLLLSMFIFVLIVICSTDCLGSLTGCSLMVPENADQSSLDSLIKINCFERDCPSQDDILYFLNEYKKDVHGDFDVFDNCSGFLDCSPLIVDWFPDDYIFRTEDKTVINPKTSNTETKTYYIIGQTLNQNHIQVTSISVFIHEITHVYYWRKLNDPDYNHADSPGPWTKEDDDKISKLGLKLRTYDE